MHASVLRDFFLEKVPARHLAADAANAFIWTSSDVRRLNWVELDSEFHVSLQHLVQLCEAVISGELPGETLDAIAFGMIADDHFLWDTDSVDGDRIGDTLNDWSAPQINYALNPSTTAKFRQRLLTGEDTFTRADFGAPSA